MCLGERMWFAHLAESPVPAALSVSECKRTTLDAVVAATEAGDLEEVQSELTAVRSQLGEVETVAAGDELIAEAKAEREAARKLQEDADHLARVWSASTLVVGGVEGEGELARGGCRARSPGGSSRGGFAGVSKRLPCAMAGGLRASVVRNKTSGRGDHRYGGLSRILATSNRLTDRRLNTSHVFFAAANIRTSSKETSAMLDIHSLPGRPTVVPT